MRVHSDPFYLEIQKTIAESGRQVMAIGPGDNPLKQPPFFYTIGNHFQGLPELLLIGPWEPKATCALMNALSAQMLERKGPFGNGELVNLGGVHSLQVWVTTVIAKLEYTLQATEFYGHNNYAVQQVVMPDPKGRYPGDKRLHKRYRVPLLRATSDIMQSLWLH